MKKLTILLIALVAINGANAQGCLPEGIGFMSQTDIDNFQVNFPGCTVIEGNVVFNGPDIINLHGLSTLTSIGGSLELTCLDNLSDLTGLDALTSIGGNLGFHDTRLTDMTGLGSLTSIGGSLDIGCLANSSIFCTNPLLENLSGLESLTYIGGYLYIADCQSLTDVDALSSLNSVGGLNIIGNSNLTSLGGLGNITADSLSYLTIAGNSSLSICDVPGICNFLNNPDGGVNIFGNSTDCNSPAEIASACGISLPCLPFGNYYFISQADVDSFQVNYPNCNELEGTLVIGIPEVLFYLDPSNISDINGLNNVYSIAGDLMISSNANLLTLTGLENLNSIGGDLEISDNDTLNSSTGLDNLDSIGGYLRISSNENLINLPGFESLTTIGDFLRISFNPSLTNVTGLQSLATIGTYLRISDNNSLNSLSGLDSVTTIGSDLRITNNPLLNACDIYSICIYLDAPNGIVEIHNNDSGCNSQEEVEQACMVSVENIFEVKPLLLFPNPASTKITISSSANSGNIQLSIFDVNGEKVIERQQIENENQIDISGLPRGVYFVRLQNEKMVEMGKIVKE